jgi:hypothetical protein
VRGKHKGVGCTVELHIFFHADPWQEHDLILNDQEGKLAHPGRGGNLETKKKRFVVILCVKIEKQVSWMFAPYLSIIILSRSDVQRDRIPACESLEVGLEKNVPSLV